MQDSVNSRIGGQSPALRGALLFGLGSRLLAQAIIDPLARQPRYAVQRRAHVSLPSKV